MLDSDASPDEEGSFMKQQFNFPIRSAGRISTLFRERGVNDFQQAAELIRGLPYRRNSVKNDVAIALLESCGTCSTKHSALAFLAIENDADEVKLMIGIFRMSKQNTPAIGDALGQHGLEYIPEAHNYLRVNGEVLDFTVRPPKEIRFIDDLVSEIEIAPDQVGEFKISYQKKTLAEWLEKNPQVQLSFEELWKIREQCIANLSV
jgi:hypothetical protein